MYNSYYNGMSAMFLVFRIVISLKIIPYMEWMFYVVSHSLYKIAFFLIAILPFFVFFIFSLFFLAGVKVKEASSITRSIFTTYRLMMGVGNTSNYYQVN